jgi:UDP-N-acetylglucosamine:LPS N-acetylglucosamine transferase
VTGKVTPERLADLVAERLRPMVREELREAVAELARPDADEWITAKECAAVGSPAALLPRPR